MRCLLCFLSLLFTCDLNALQVSGLTYLKDFERGESAQVRVTLISDKNKPELIDLKLCDYSCNSEGQHFFDEIGSQTRSNASWIKLGSYREIVNPGESRDLYFTINVPNDESLKGSYWSVLMIEPSDPLQTLTESEHGFQLNIKIRYAFHVVTNVGKGIPSLKITKKSIEPIEEKKYLAVDVVNPGELFLNPKMIVKLYNQQGKLEKTLETQSERLYPGSSSRFLANGEGLSDGKYTAFLLLDNGDGRLFGDTFTLSLP